MKRTASARKKLSGNVTSTKTAQRAATFQTRFAVCVHNKGFPVALDLRKIYKVLPDERAARDGYLRVVDESGENYLYPTDWFLPITLPPTAAGTLTKSFRREARDTNGGRRKEAKIKRFLG